MADKIRRVDYFYFEVEDRPGGELASWGSWRMAASRCSPSSRSPRREARPSAPSFGEGGPVPHGEERWANP